MIAALAQIGLSTYGAMQGRKAAKKARKEQKQYLSAALAEYDKLSAMYRPGSDYSDRLMEDLKKQGELDVGRTMQQRLQSGIGGTSYGDVYSKYQQNVARPARMRLEDFLADKYAGVAQQKAGLLSGVQVSGPSYGNIASSSSQIGEGIGNLVSAFSQKGVDPDKVTSQASSTSKNGGVSPWNYLKSMFGFGSKKK